MTRTPRLLAAIGIAVASAATTTLVVAQQPHSGHSVGTPGTQATPTPPAPAPTLAPRRVSEEELHRNGGIPRGWKFSVPPGDAVRGRELFDELECYKCHAITTEKLPVPLDGKYLGPELTGMGRVHPTEYIAESILFPNAVIVDEPGHTGPDGLSKMPSYADSLSVQQWLDLVAYLKSLTEGGEHPEGHGVERVATVGDYRVRVVYAGADHAGHGEHGAAGGHAGHGAPAPPVRRATGHLMAYVTERETGEAIPYLPVSATVHGPGRARRTITLRPMVGDGGFHYGADVTLPERAAKLTFVIGPTTLRVLPSAKARVTKPVTAVFDLSAPAK